MHGMQTMTKAATLLNAPTHYRVAPWAPGGATIRTRADPHADVLGRLRCGADWYGDAVSGTAQTMLGFGSSRMWVEDARGFFVWSGMLEKVRA